MQIEPLSAAHLDAIATCEGGNGWKSDPAHWDHVLQMAEAGQRLTLVARSGDLICGYGSLLWQSDYASFRSAHIPEIHDLVTAQAFRRRGVARPLIAAFEQVAAQRAHTQIGLGVGLYADYGPAQRLYAKLGYVPDGKGVTYRGAAVVPGEARPVDDDLVLWLVRRLP